uniref:mitotic spindle assembly checkpoint protein MAD2A-like n=1 Tax=Styela clava TaxID=7725 RepID=UPI001939F917|nr:mitotic spindle assembly checkpoint protein MAD2A-like [Styela clava]
MPPTQQASLNKITLKGSAAIVSEFFYYGINSILYQRGIYPAEMFTREKKYGLTILVCTDDKIKEYLEENVCPQLTEWLEQGVVNRLVVVIKDVDTKEPLERWQFEIDCDKTVTSKDGEKNHKTKEIAEIHKEICAVIRQITATVTFLPLLETACSFDVLFYTSHDAENISPKLEESSAFLITDSQEVKLRSFNTTVHKVEGAVSYKFNTIR